MSKILVAYFSVSGVTKRYAEEIAEAEQAALYEITPAEPYTAADLDWTNKNSRSTLEMTDPNSRPAIAGSLPDLTDVDIIFLGFPIWWGREPSIVDTFLDGFDFTGKTIIPFATSGGSGFGNTSERIANLIGRKGKVMEGQRLGGTVSVEDLKLWFEGLDI